MENPTAPSDLVSLSNSPTYFNSTRDKKKKSQSSKSQSSEKNYWRYLVLFSCFLQITNLFIMMKARKGQNYLSEKSSKRRKTLTRLKSSRKKKWKWTGKSLFSIQKLLGENGFIPMFNCKKKRNIDRHQLSN